MVEVEGSAITARIRWVRDRYGEPAYRRLRGALSEEHRTLLEGRILPHAWVPFDLFVSIDVEADRLFGRGDPALCREMPSFLIRKAAPLPDVHYSSGRLTVEEEQGGVHLRIDELAQPHRAHRPSVLGWPERSMELSGAQIPYAEEERCRTRGDDVCEIVARWR